MKLVSLLVLLALVQALVIIDLPLASACVYYLKEFNWGCGGYGQGAKLYKCRCENEDWVALVMACIESQNPKGDDNAAHAIKHINRRCWDKGRLTFAPDYLPQTLEAMRDRFIEAPIKKKAIINNPVQVNRSDYLWYEKSFDQVNHHVKLTQWLGWGLNWYWAAVLLPIGWCHWFPVSRWPWWTQHMNRSTFVGLRWGWREVTNRDWLIITGFLVQTILSTAIGYNVDRPNAYIGDSKLLTLDLIGYRLGIISFSLMPLTFFFGIRNNPFQWVTGLSYAEFSFYHKVLSVVMALEAMIHTGVWTGYAIIDGGYDGWAVDAYWRWGIVGMILATLLVLLSLRFIRHLMYETFLFFHKIFAVLFIVLMWYHCNTLGWMGWVYALIAIMAWDRLVRLFRIVTNGGVHRISVQIAEKGVVRLVINDRRVHYFPGCYCFFYFLNPRFGGLWQSHPFTVIQLPIEEEGVLVVYFKVRDGVTRDLYFSNKLSVLAFIEGPYGSPASARFETPAVDNCSIEEEKRTSDPLSYGSSLDQAVVASGTLTSKLMHYFHRLLQTHPLVPVTIAMAGGMGICALIPHLYDLANSTAADVPMAPSKLYWIINDICHINWIYRDLAYLHTRGCLIKIIVTGATMNEDMVTEIGRFCPPTIFDLRLRPQLHSIVSDAISKHAHTRFLVCGPNEFNHDIRDLVGAHPSATPSSSIEIRCESFVW